MATATQNKLVVRRQGEEVQLGGVENLVKGDIVNIDKFRMMYVGVSVTDSLLMVGRTDDNSITCVEASKGHVSIREGYLSRLPSNNKSNFKEKSLHNGTIEFAIAHYALQQGGHYER